MSPQLPLPSRQLRTLALGLVALIPLSDASGSEPGFRWGYLSNGSGYLVIENRAAPMIGCSAVVLGGSGAETPSSQGASHMLEHLLFNGTETRTQEELYAAFDRLGTYSNATTRPTHVNYMILAPSARFWESFDLQVDMIFRSTLPPEKLEKERGIVLEELAKGKLEPGYATSRVLEIDLFGPRGYGLPTLGTETSIRALTREQILSFYRAFYGPEHLIWILIGDLDPDAAVDSLEARIGAFPARDTHSVPAAQGLETAGVRQRIHRIAVDAPRVRLAWVGPNPNSEAFLALEAAFHLACEGETTPLGERATQLGALSYAASLRLFPGFSLLEVECELGDGIRAESFVEELRAAAGEAAAAPVDAAALERWKIGRETDEIFLREKPHYYAVFRGDRIAARGLAAIASELSDIARLEAVDLAGALPLTAAPDRVTILLPTEKSAGTSGAGASPHGAPGMGHGAHPGAAQASMEEETDDGDTSADPATSSASAEDLRWTLPNGLHVVARSGPESQVFAAHVFVRGRSAREPAPGAAELLHSLLGRATENRDAASLSAALAEIGAELKTHDDPMIPYDDFYSVPEFSYVRFQTLDRFAEAGLDLLAEILARPRFGPEEFDEARSRAIEKAIREEATPRARVRQAIFDTYAVAGSNAYVFGTAAALQSLDFDTLRDFAPAYLDPRAMFVVIASGLPRDELRDRIAATLGRIPQSESAPDPRWTVPPWDLSDRALAGQGESGTEATEDRPTAGAAAVDPVLWTETFGSLPLPDLARLESLGASQSYLMLTRVVEVPREIEADVQLATALLSDRIAFQLREREGLAYSIGASLSPLSGTHWIYQAGAGTRAENLPRMLEGLRNGVDIALAEPIDAQSLTTLVAGLEGRALMRRITRMNWAYYAGSSWLRGEEPAKEIEIFEEMRAVEPDAVARALRGVLAEGEEGVFLVR